MGKSGWFPVILGIFPRFSHETSRQPIELRLRLHEGSPDPPSLPVREVDQSMARWKMIPGSPGPTAERFELVEPTGTTWTTPRTY